jgi:hypothetical protein
VKPTSLLTEAIRDVTRQGEIVVSAFSGSGSTILACERSKRVSYACLTLVIDTWLSGARDAREPTSSSSAQREAPLMIVGENGNELTSLAILR